MNSKDFTHEKTIAIIALLLITSNIFSQTTNKLLDSSTVKHQFESLIDKSNNFQGYKVIKTTSLFKLQSNVLDFLFQKKQASKRRLSEFSKQLIDSLQTKSIASKRLFLI
jgi:hypothetical protein